MGVGPDGTCHRQKLCSVLPVQISGAQMQKRDAASDEELSEEEVEEVEGEFSDSGDEESEEEEEEEAVVEGEAVAAGKTVEEEEEVSVQATEETTASPLPPLPTRLVARVLRSCSLACCETSLLLCRGAARQAAPRANKRRCRSPRCRCEACRRGDWEQCSQLAHETAAAAAWAPLLPGISHGRHTAAGHRLLHVQGPAGASQPFPHPLPALPPLPGCAAQAAGAI